MVTVVVVVADDDFLFTVTMTSINLASRVSAVTACDCDRISYYSIYEYVRIFAAVNLLQPK